MAFIDKKDPVVLNIKVTSKGRETLSKGHLHFRYFAIGDSEIDYDFIKETQQSPSNFNPFNSKILRPADKNPDMLSFITRNFLTEDELFDEFAEEDQYNEITTVPSITWEVENTAESIGFFSENNGVFTFKVTPEYIKQPDLLVSYSAITGNSVVLTQAPTYGANITNPIVGDYLLVRWKDDGATFNTIGYTIDKENPAPILIYKILTVDGDINSGSVEVTLDRDLPVFNDDTLSAGAMVLYGDVTLNVEQEFSTDYASEALLTFLQNCQCDTLVFPFWKLSIIHTDNVAGVQLDDKQFGQNKSAIYGGFVNYIQNQEATIKKLGVIHYTNVSPANVYAEQFLRRTPTIHLPTIMWHKSTGATVGVTLKAVGDLKTITAATTRPSLNTNYYDLADESGNIVGKVFVELKIFVIEDQELLFAMSYKSNRSWTLPNFNIGANDSITDCPICEGIVDFTFTSSDTTSIGGTNGSITITDVTGLINSLGATGMTYLKIEKTTGAGGIFFSDLINSSILNNPIGGLSAGTYKITIIDLGAPYTPDCETSKNAIINDPFVFSATR